MPPKQESMFALIRHAEYHIDSGTITDRGRLRIQNIACFLQAAPQPWEHILSSPSARAIDTAHALSERLNNIPVQRDTQLCTGTNLGSLFPPIVPDGVIIVTHLPVLTILLRTWAHFFEHEEPPLLEIGNGYLVDSEKQLFTLLSPIIADESSLPVLISLDRTQLNQIHLS